VKGVVCTSFVYDRSQHVMQRYKTRDLLSPLIQQQTTQENTRRPDSDLFF
jgi:hypothetical protein